ncbi:MAG: hypothetical protein ACRCY3_03450 [Sphingorhabdus sp.]
MKAYRFILVSLLFCSLQSTALAGSKPVYGPKLPGFSNQPVTRIEFKKLEEISDFYMPSFPTFDLKIETEKDPGGKYDWIITGTHEILPSNIRSAEQSRVGVKISGDLFIVKTVGSRWKCIYGKNRENWTTKQCKLR